MTYFDNESLQKAVDDDLKRRGVKRGAVVLHGEYDASGDYWIEARVVWRRDDHFEAGAVLRKAKGKPLAAGFEVEYTF